MECQPRVPRCRCCVVDLWLDQRSEFFFGGSYHFFVGVPHCLPTKRVFFRFRITKLFRSSLFQKNSQWLLGSFFFGENLCQVGEDSFLHILFWMMPFYFWWCLSVREVDVYIDTHTHMYIFIYTPGPQMTLVLIVKGLFLEGWSSKIRGQVPGSRYFCCTVKLLTLHPRRGEWRLSITVLSDICFSDSFSSFGFGWPFWEFKVSWIFSCVANTRECWKKI